VVVTYKCPGCGAAMEFDGESGKLSCESCGTQLTVEEYNNIPLGEDTYTSAEHEESPTIQVQIFKCPSCGAELMTDEHTAATICSYCGNPGLIPDRMAGVHSPKAVLPFRITKEHVAWYDRNGMRMMAIYHPSALLRDPSKRPETFDDLKNLQREIQRICPNTQLNCPWMT